MGKSAPRSLPLSLYLLQVVVSIASVATEGKGHLLLSPSSFSEAISNDDVGRVFETVLETAVICTQQ